MGYTPPVSGCFDTGNDDFHHWSSQTRQFQKPRHALARGLQILSAVLIVQKVHSCLLCLPMDFTHRNSGGMIIIMISC